MIVFFYPTVFTSDMWKNIFIESCLLSALIFGGFYIQSKIIRAEINSSDRSIQRKITHISGGIYPELSESIRKITHISGGIYPELIVTNEHLSGVKTKLPIGHLSGEKQNLTTK